jgi:hydrogenase nickel incorporation protein HypA/HybF
MHELAVTESILNISLEHAKKVQASRVTDINLTIGRLSSIVDDSVQFYWDLISEKTICEGAKLHFTRLAARLSCQDCGKEYTLESELTPCPQCGSNRIKVLSGDEFWVDSIQVEKEQELQKEQS